MIRVGQGRKNGKWVAVAYHDCGIVMEKAIDPDKAQACLLLASKLLSRLHKLNSVMDKNQGSISFGMNISLIDEAQTPDYDELD